LVACVRDACIVRPSPFCRFSHTAANPQNLDPNKLMPTAKKSAQAKAKVRFQDLKPKSDPKGGTLTVTTPKLGNPVIKITTGGSASNPAANTTVSDITQVFGP
jgi:hypothetical protein